MGLVLALLASLLWYGFFRTVEVIETEAVRRASIENTVSALGVLQPHRYVDVGAQVSGQVKRIAVTVGGMVKKGDLLLEIDPALQQATVAANRATLAGLRAQLSEQEALRDLAQRQARRQRNLAAEDATRQEDVDTAEANLRVTAARIANLRAQIEGAQSVLQGNEALLGYTRIYAPIDGTVVTLDAREGQTLNATYQTPNLLCIADLSRISPRWVCRTKRGVRAAGWGNSPKSCPRRRRKAAPRLPLPTPRPARWCSIPRFSRWRTRTAR